MNIVKKSPFLALFTIAIFAAGLLLFSQQAWGPMSGRMCYFEFNMQQIKDYQPGDILKAKDLNNNMRSLELKDSTLRTIKKGDTVLVDGVEHAVLRVDRTAKGVGITFVSDEPHE